MPPGGQRAFLVTDNSLSQWLLSAFLRRALIGASLGTVRPLMDRGGPREERACGGGQLQFFSGAQRSGPQTLRGREGGTLSYANSPQLKGEDNMGVQAHGNVASREQR